MTLSPFVGGLLSAGTPGTTRHVSLSSGGGVIRTYVDGVLVETRSVEISRDET